ncbi:hypothetical protein [Aliivibrio fischeri]|uniref:hypothetical protein n=1 Tax=Aliivibrio fischeri TaxID=668 RepID=UPI0007C4F44F|nr:hypothetical protein [Aliivibrio fischeri]CAH7002327.1 conserved hypothetical protein [Vibrio chagasii]
MKEEDVIKVVSKMSELGIDLSIDSYILVGVISLFSATLGVFISSYLKKKGEQKAISEEFNDIKNRLIQTTQLTEDIKSNIAKDSHEYHFKFEKYHEKRIEVIERLYELLINIEDNATSYIVTSNFGDGQNDVFKKAKGATEEFIAYSKLRKFWVPIELYNEIEELAILLDKHVYSILLQVGSKTAQDAGIERGITASNDAIDTLQNKVPEAKERIVESIRKLLDPTYS